MRFKSLPTGGYTAYAVTGVHTVSFAIGFLAADITGLLGFAVERYDPVEREKYFMPNMKVFEAIIPNPTPSTRASSFNHPVQSFVWDDFTTKPGRKYTYYFYPIKGCPKNLDRTAPPIAIEVETELASNLLSAHDIYFNRGVASSQAYATKFNNKPPDDMDDDEQKRAFDWLGRGLDQAILDFIIQAQPGDQLRAAFYEFRYPAVADAFEDAIAKGVDVQIIYDAKVNESTDKKGVFHESFPREANKRTIRTAGIPLENVIERAANESHIQHNKFIVYSKGGAPTSVWTGSTNISEGGIFGQTNVGHCIRDAAVAQKFINYWDLLATDPGAQTGDTRGKRTQDNKEYKKEVVAIQQDIEFAGKANIPNGTTPFFSPRNSQTMLKTYAQMLDNAETEACITLAFGINNEFKDLLTDNTNESQLIFMLLEKQDKPNANSTKPFVKLGAFNNIYQSFGSNIKDPLAQWAKETTTRHLALNQHVAYIHSKFLLMEPLSESPVVITGSANFSDASTRENDENMLMIKGDKRVADIYFTEFMRLFNHYYFRSVFNLTKDDKPEEIKNETAFLDTTGKWLEKYEPGKLRFKRVQMFARMDAQIL